MDYCLGCNVVLNRNEEDINYILCDACREEGEGESDEATIMEKASLVFKNGMKWDDVLNFFDLVILEQEDCIKIFEKFGVKEKKVVEWYESWEGSNDGA